MRLRRARESSRRSKGCDAPFLFAPSVFYFLPAKRVFLAQAGERSRARSTNDSRLIFCTDYLLAWLSSGPASENSAVRFQRENSYGTTGRCGPCALHRKRLCGAPIAKQAPCGSRRILQPTLSFECAHSANNKDRRVMQWCRAT